MTIEKLGGQRLVLLLTDNQGKCSTESLQDYSSRNRYVRKYSQLDDHNQAVSQRTPTYFLWVLQLAQVQEAPQEQLSPHILMIWESS
jgi:hypothetical protein